MMRKMLLIWCILVYVPAVAQVNHFSIVLNQVGFYPEAPKMAVVLTDSGADKFFITSHNDSTKLFAGTLGIPVTSDYSSLVTRKADFTAFRMPGNFLLHVPGAGKPVSIRIGDEVYTSLSAAVLKGYYFQRSSTALAEKYAGAWHRPAGHPDTAVQIHPSAATQQRPAGSTIASPGGWYDAGDYNKYIVNSGITMGTLLSAYEDYPEHFRGLRTGIPESSNAVPDILDEVIYNLRWMLTMQDPLDGGVYNKCTNADFDGVVMPGITRAPRYVVQKSTAATLDFAAVTAQAARVIQDFSDAFPGLADSCRKAALAAWEWALLHPDMKYDQQAMNKLYKPVINTGGYGDSNFSDEWFWAAAELFITTREREFFDKMEENSTDSLTIPSWNNVRMLGAYSLIRAMMQLPAYSAPLAGSLKKQVIRLAERYTAGGNAAFGTVMGYSERDYNWGGNSNAANQGILLTLAYRLTRRTEFLHRALSNIDYLLGRNATGYCFVTGAGYLSPMFPHHRPSAADNIDKPVPGLLVGGPNKGMQDKCIYQFKETETAFTDRFCSYASNEIAINWNAPLVYLVNAIEFWKRAGAFAH